MYINQMKIKIINRIMLIEKILLKKSDLVVLFFKIFIIIKSYNKNDNQIIVIILISNMLFYCRCLLSLNKE